MKNKRVFYALAFALLMATEFAIALFVHDDFIRPYVGDILVVPLIIAFLRIFCPGKPLLLPLYVTLFAFATEALQYADIVGILGLRDNRIAETVIGTTFDANDLLCYAIGGAVFLAAEIIIKKFISKQDE
jgi:hypothetical protein